MKNTVCQRCCFADTIDSDRPCAFDIPNLIKDIHEISIVDQYYEIKQYQCRYGFDKKTYETNIDKFEGVDLPEYIIKNNEIKYSLFILLSKNDDYAKIVTKIHQLSIPPSRLFFICYNNGRDLSNYLSNSDPYINFKIGHFLEEMTYARALHTLFETNKSKVGNLMWILESNILDMCIENDSIQNINFMINTEQRPCHYYKNKNIDSQFNGVFIPTNNYWHLSKTQDYQLDTDESIVAIDYE